LKVLTPEESVELKRYTPTLYQTFNNLSQFDALIENVKFKIGIERIKNGG